MAPDDLRRHIEIKVATRSITPQLGAEMQRLADDGYSLDYEVLKRRALYGAEAPRVAYHTAPATAREAIRREGLLARRPAQHNWAEALEEEYVMVCDQPAGVYITRTPDRRGVWSHWPAWDVWAFATEGLTVVHDVLNPGCWMVTEDVHPGRLRLVASKGEGLGRG